MALQLMKLFCPDYNHTGTMIRTHHRNHLQLLPLRLHHHPTLRPHLPAPALVHHHPILYSFSQIPPHPPLHHGRHPPAVLLPPLSLQRWIVPINVLLMDEVVISGKLHDTGLLHRHRLRLILLRFHHHFRQRLLCEFYAAALVHLFDSGARVQNSAFYDFTELFFLSFSFSFSLLPFPFPSLFFSFLSLIAFLHLAIFVTSWSLPPPLPFSSQFCSFRVTFALNDLSL